MPGSDDAPLEWDDMESGQWYHIEVNWHGDHAETNIKEIEQPSDTEGKRPDDDTEEDSDT